MKQQGVIKWFDNAVRRWGWIIPDTGKGDLFLHGDACLDGYVPQRGDRVAYTVTTDFRHNKDKAIMVELVEPAK